jgi:hypothetical protein
VGHVRRVRAQPRRPVDERRKGRRRDRPPLAAVRRARLRLGPRRIPGNQHHEVGRRGVRRVAEQDDRETLSSADGRRVDPCRDPCRRRSGARPQTRGRDRVARGERRREDASGGNQKAGRARAVRSVRQRAGVGRHRRRPAPHPRPAPSRTTPGTNAIRSFPRAAGGCRMGPSSASVWSSPASPEARTHRNFARHP